MERSKISELYDDGYAAAYDERFLTGPPWAAVNSDFEVELLGELLDQPDPHWLDVACGTGWFLSRFPAVERIGIDLSSAMLAQSRRANPGVELIEGSFLDPHPEWVDAWSLVSCMWFAYAYVDTVDTVEAVLANLARWTAPGGRCFVPVCDLVDLSGGTDVPYLNTDTWTFGGPMKIVGFVWSWTDDEHAKQHRNLVCPHLDHMVATFGRWFAEVEVVHYPPLHPGWGGRRAIVAGSKRTQLDEGPPVVVTHRVEPYRGAIDIDSEDDHRSGGDDTSSTDSPETLVDDSVAPLEAAIDEISETAPPKTGVPESRRRGAWRGWWALPPVARRIVRSAWRVIPAGSRRCLTAALSDDEPVSPSDRRDA